MAKTKEEKLAEQIESALLDQSFDIGTFTNHLFFVLNPIAHKRFFELMLFILKYLNINNGHRIYPNGTEWASRWSKIIVEVLNKNEAKILDYVGQR